MMSYVIELFVLETTDIGKAWIFAEDLSRELQKTGLGILPMAEADAVKDFLRIRDIQARKLKRCRDTQAEKVPRIG
jgi:hypothetical protein